MTEKELYFQMVSMRPQFEQYKAKQLSALNADQVAQMGIIFNAVKQVYPISGLPRLFTSSCSSCIISTLEKFIMIYDRLHPIYQVNETPKAKRKRKDNL